VTDAEKDTESEYSETLQKNCFQLCSPPAFTTLIICDKFCLKT